MVVITFCKCLPFFFNSSPSFNFPACFALIIFKNPEQPEGDQKGQPPLHQRKATTATSTGHVTTPRISETTEQFHQSHNSFHNSTAGEQSATCHQPCTPTHTCTRMPTPLGLRHNPSNCRQWWKIRLFIFLR